MLLLCITFSVCYAEGFNDMPEKEHWSYNALNYAIENKILQGYDDGSIKPDENLKRAQAAAIVIRTFDSDKHNEFPGFDDVVQSSWFYDVVKESVEKGFFMGSEGKFFPDTEITRQEAFTVIYRSLGLTPVSEQNNFGDKQDISVWASDAVNALYANGYIHGSEENYLYPLNYITRAEFAQILYNISIAKPDESESDKGISNTDNKPVNSGASQGGGSSSSGDKHEANNYGNGDTYSDDIF